MKDGYPQEPGRRLNRLRGRGKAAAGAVGSDGIVLAPPLLDQHGRLRQRAEDLPVQQLVPELAVEPHWARLRTTNSLERLHTEIKRRIRSAGAFPDRASALRLITTVALRTTAVWSERRYLDLSLLEPKEVAKAA